MGEVAVAFDQAHGEWMRGLARAEGAPWREAHGLRRRAKSAGEQLGPLKDRFEALAAPERARLEAELPEARKALADLEGRYYGNLHFQIAHPEALRRLDRLDDQIATLGYQLDIGRQGLDGIVARPPEPHQPRRGIGLEREAPGLELTIERDFGLGL